MVTYYQLNKMCGIHLVLNVTLMVDSLLSYTACTSQLGRGIGSAGREFWVVTDWMADKLSEQGEIVDDNFFGQVVWGRTPSATDDALCLDNVFRKIYTDYDDRLGS